jgi:hypothetical protein
LYYSVRIVFKDVTNFEYNKKIYKRGFGLFLYIQMIQVSFLKCRKAKFKIPHIGNIEILRLKTLMYSLFKLNVFSMRVFILYYDFCRKVLKDKMWNNTLYMGGPFFKFSFEK